MNYPTQDELLAAFTYDPITGQLFNKTYRSNAAIPGTQAGGLQKVKGRTYRRMLFNGRRLYTHCAIYIMHHGFIPDGYVIDHDDQDGMNNRIGNLNAVTRLQNAHNIKMSKRNKTGVTGVYKSKSGNRWFAEIVVNFKKIWLGSFVRFEDACKARFDAQRLFGFNPNHGLCAA